MGDAASTGVEAKGLIDQPRRLNVEAKRLMHEVRARRR
jgi:hypothetical protein